jgi:hypothetical protein
MREARYPLAAARVQRDHARQQAEDALRAARSGLQDAELAVEAVRGACRAHDARRANALAPPPPGGGGPKDGRPSLASAEELARSGVYAARLQIESGRLAQQLRAAQARVTEQARAVRLAEMAWHKAYAEREALERHHARFREAERKAAERAYELEVEERAQHKHVLARS